MSTYFKPPRRKIGVAILVLSLLFAIAWLRSCRESDDIRIGTLFGTTYTVTSTRGDFEFASWPQYPKKWNSRWQTWQHGGKGLGEDRMIEADRYMSLNNPLPGDVREWGEFTGTESERLEFKWPIRFTEAHLTVIEYLDRNTRKPEVKYTGRGVTVSFWFVTLPMFFLAEHLIRGKPRAKKRSTESPPYPES